MTTDADADARDRLCNKRCDQHMEKARASALARHSDDEDLRILLQKVFRQVNALALDNQKEKTRTEECAIKMNYRFDQVIEGQNRLERRLQRLQRMIAGEKRGDSGADGCFRRGSLSWVPEGEDAGNVMEESGVPDPESRRLSSVPEQGTSALEPGSETLQEMAWADQGELAEKTQGTGLTVVENSVGSFKREGRSAKASRIQSDEAIEGERTHLDGALEIKQDAHSPGLLALAKEAGMKITSLEQRQGEAQQLDGALELKQDSHGLLALAEQVGMTMTSSEQRQEEAQLLNILPGLR